MEKSKRKHGYYRVKFQGEWEIAKFYRHLGQDGLWDLAGYGRMSDVAFDEIDEKEIDATLSTPATQSAVPAEGDLDNAALDYARRMPGWPVDTFKAGAKWAIDNLHATPVEPYPESSGMKSKRDAAMFWFSKCNDDGGRDYYTNMYYPGRTKESLTGREIEDMYCRIFRVLDNDIAEKG